MKRVYKSFFTHEENYKRVPSNAIENLKLF